MFLLENDSLMSILFCLPAMGRKRCGSPSGLAEMPQVTYLNERFYRIVKVNDGLLNIYYGF